MRGLLLYAGLIILGHAVYVALSVKDELQAWHHGRTYLPALAFAGISVPTSALIAALVVESLVGVLVALFGAVSGLTLRPARLAETTRYDRYDRSMYTGVGFTHFNHRGRLSSAAEKSGSDGSAATCPSKSTASKKKD